MDWKQSYSDTKIELQLLQIREFELRKRWEAAHKVVMTGEMPSTIYCHVGLDKGIELYNKAAEDLNEVVNECTRLEGILNQMEAHMNQFTGLSNVIKCKRMEGKSYKQIAVETGYNEKYLRNYNSKSGKEMAHSTNVS